MGLLSKIFKKKQDTIPQKQEVAKAQNTHSSTKSQQDDLDKLLAFEKKIEKSRSRGYKNKEEEEKYTETPEEYRVRQALKLSNPFRGE